LKNFGKPFKEIKPTIVPRTFSSNNLPTDSARELFKPFKEAKCLPYSIFKNPDTFEFERLLVRRHHRERSTNFCMTELVPEKKAYVAI